MPSPRAAQPGGSSSPIDEGPPAARRLASTDTDMIRELARQDLVARRVELLSALASADWPRVGKIAHYLVTTADLLADAELRAACTACTQAVRADDFSRARDAASIIASLPDARANATPSP
jgi:hypothetical protein